MNARRRSNTKGLPSRVYEKHGAFFWVRKSDGKWIKLCAVSDGTVRMLTRLTEEMRRADSSSGMGDMPKHVQAYIEAEAPRKSETSRKEWKRQGATVKAAFRDWNVADMDAAAVKEFLETNWPDQLPSRRSYRAWMSGFFGWAIIKRLRSDNPCKDVKLPKPQARDVYIANGDFLKIRDGLLIGRDKKKTPTGDMMQCFVDLCYLTTQRSTDIRNLKWSQIDHVRQVIRFQPSKTKKSSGGRVDWPITKAIEEVLLRASSLKTKESDYVIRDDEGAPKTAGAVRDAWMDAKDRAGLADKPYTIKDIRAMALTDAENQGYTLEQLSIAAVHTDTKTTEIYLKGKKVPVSMVELKLPKSDTE